MKICKVQNDEGAAAYDKLRDELNSTVKKLWEAEQKQLAAEEQVEFPKGFASMKALGSSSLSDNDDVSQVAEEVGCIMQAGKIDALTLALPSWIPCNALL